MSKHTHYLTLSVDLELVIGYDEKTKVWSAYFTELPDVTTTGVDAGDATLRLEEQVQQLFELRDTSVIRLFTSDGPGYVAQIKLVPNTDVL